MNPEKIIVGSRESKLAVIQSETLIEYIRNEVPGKDAELLTLKTTGDKILDRTLTEIGGKGLFVKELDIALRDKRADVTVHSLKDVPMEIAEDIPLIGFSGREDPRDVLVLPKGKTEIDPSLPIGSSSLRRVIQLKKLYPHMEIAPVRGNLQTRLRKLDEGQYSALVLAAAGLKRLGLADRINRYFTVDELIPAAGQGILALQGRKDEDYGFLSGFLDEKGTAAALCERAFVTELNGGCTSPVCAHAEIRDDEILLRGLYYNEETKEYTTGTLTGPKEEARELGARLARELRGR
ncbi:MAG: hydroxymethylbilane synthase [Lachnospiraceae bacterium]|nr:hydroxymethylbilane synthase [Lachnospiraceae bacterium]